MFVQSKWLRRRHWDSPLPALPAAFPPWEGGAAQASWQSRAVCNDSLPDTRPTCLPPHATNPTPSHLTLQSITNDILALGLKFLEISVVMKNRAMLALLVWWGCSRGGCAGEPPRGRPRWHGGVALGLCWNVTYWMAYATSGSSWGVGQAEALGGLGPGSASTPPRRLSGPQFLVCERQSPPLGRAGSAAQVVSAGQLACC